MNSDIPVKCSGKLIPKEKAVKMFVFSRKYQVKHVNGLTYDFLYEIAKNLSEGVTAHKKDFDVSHVIAMEPMNWNGKKVLENLDIELVRNNQFLCHYEDFAEWTSTKTKFKTI